MFEIRMLSLFGYRPHLIRCGLCKRDWEEMMESPNTFFSLEKGTLVCDRCSKSGERLVPLSLGTARLIDQIAQVDLAKLNRLRFTAQALAESRGLLPRFISHQLGKELKSLKAIKSNFEARNTKSETIPNDQNSNVPDKKFREFGF